VKVRRKSGEGQEKIWGKSGENQVKVRRKSSEGQEKIW
jgi:hypothetical protein